MGYTTQFDGKFKLSKKLTAKRIKIINDFAEERHEQTKNSKFPKYAYYCQWITDGEAVYWDEGEKFYAYIEWLQYLIDNFFNPWKISLSGDVIWNGEEPGDIGMIYIEGDKVKSKAGRMVFSPE